jgi:hypothetical protein
VRERNSAATSQEPPQSAVPRIMPVAAGAAFAMRVAQSDKARDCSESRVVHNKGDATVPKLTVAEIAEEILKMFDLDGEALGFAMEELHNRVRSEEADREVATKMLTEGFLDAMRRSNEKELREFARIKFESFSAVGRKPN